MFASPLCVGPVRNPEDSCIFFVPRIKYLKKKNKYRYVNTFVSARGYLDDDKHPPTGGGPYIPPPPSLQLIITRLGDKPNMRGLASGIDTECNVYSNQHMKMLIQHRDYLGFLLHTK